MAGAIFDVRFEKHPVSLAQRCKCGSITGVVTQEWRNHMLYTDTWTCAACGAVLFWWVASEPTTSATNDPVETKPTKQGSLF